MRSLRFVPALIGLAVAGLGAVASTAVSEKYGFTTYRENVDGVVVLVDAYPAALHDGDRYIPVPVAIGLVGSREPVLVTPESFLLVDGAGKALPAATYEELSRNYPKRQFDAALFRSRPMFVGNQFSASMPVRGDFYPAPATGTTRVDRVQLYPFTWFHTVLYFPRPEAGLGGVMTLRLSGGGVETPVDVRFAVPKVFGRKGSPREG